MHINSHFTPANFGLSSRPDHAANPSGRAHQVETAPADAKPTATASAVAATEETEETETPGRSVAREARGHLATLQGLEGRNFGWLVSLIAQGAFDVSDYEIPDEGTEGEGGESAVAGTGETGEGEAATAATETAAASEEDTAASPDETADAVAGLVDDLVDELLEDGEEDGEDGSEVT